MQVVVTDYSFPDLEIERGILAPLGHELVAWKEKRPPAELQTLVANADAVLTQFATVSADVIASMQRVKVIVRYGIGVDNVDLSAAAARGIPVCNVPDYCIDEVADHTVAFLLATTRQVLPNCMYVRQGNWGLATSLDAMRAARDLTVGVVGFGRIGREVVARLRPFKCRLLAYDPGVPSDEMRQAGCEPVAMETLVVQSDVITLHCPSTPQTRGMVNRPWLAKTKQGVILINVARGDLVDSDALVDALRDGHVAAAALDVFAPEPIPAHHPLLQMDNVLVASHIASASPRAVRRLRETAANLAVAALRGDPLPNVVNGIPRGDVRISN